MTKLRRSWVLARASWGVLRAEPHLAALPVCSFAASLAALGAFAVGIWFTLGRDTGLDGSTTTTANAATWVLGALAYVTVAFVQTYFLAALCAGANERLQGRDATFRGALAAASARVSRILGWALVAATVSMIIQAVEERLGWIGRLVANLLGAAWAVVTFLTVPIIVFEDLGPWPALRRSGELFRRTWGENLTAQVGFSLLAVVAVLPAAVVVVLTAVSQVAALTVLGVVVGVAWVAVVATLLAALSGIYRTALYRYAVDGAVPAPFAGADLAHAFAPKGAGGRAGGRWS
jgi:hypothetical protein